MGRDRMRVGDLYSCSSLDGGELVQRTSWALALVCALGALSISACGGTSDPGSASRSTAAPVAARNEARTLTIDGRTREYGLSVPAGAGDHPPVLMLVHLLTLGEPRRTGAGDATPLFNVALAQRAAVVVPVGIDFSFNGGTCCGTAVREQLDDAAFLKAVAEDVVTRDGVDPERVYLVGFSNGGFLAYRMACEQPELFAGIAVVEGALLVPACAPSAPTDLLVIHQRGDDTVPFAGTPASNIPGDPVPLPPVADSLDRYLAGAGCGTEARSVRHGREVTTKYRCGRRRAQLVAVSGGAHQFPSAADGLDGAKVIAGFFGLDRRSTR